MNINDAFPSKHMKAAQFVDRPPVTKTISNVVMEEIGQEKEEKPVMYFAGETQGLVLNKTKATALGEAFGYDTEAWSGKAVKLSPARVQYGAKMVDSIDLQPILESAAAAFG